MAAERVVDTTCGTADAPTRLAPLHSGGRPRQSDELLARLAASGGERPFTAIYDRYSAVLHRYCYSILRNEADAQDAVQSTFTKALVALRQGRRAAPLRPWLYRIAHNEAISLLRENRAAEGRLGREPPPLDAPSVEERAGDRARLSALLEDLSMLPDRARAALVMRELGGLSHEEIAATLGLSTGAAKQAIFEARKGLLEFGEGRAMSCDDVTRRLSDGDGRAFRGRRLRAHLRDCRACAAFAAAIPQRGAQLRALTPVMAPACAAAVLERVIDGARLHGGTSAGTGPTASNGAGANGAGSSASGPGWTGSGPSAAGGVSGFAASGGSGAGMLAKGLTTAFAPKFLLGLAVAMGVAAGGFSVGVPLHSSRPGAHGVGSHGRGGAAANGLPQPSLAADRAGGRPGATECTGCGSPPGTHGEARGRHAASQGRQHQWGHGAGRHPGSSRSEGRHLGRGPGAGRHPGSSGNEGRHLGWGQGNGLPGASSRPAPPGPAARSHPAPASPYGLRRASSARSNNSRAHGGPSRNPRAASHPTPTAPPLIRKPASQVSRGRQLAPGASRARVR
ncbi:MAG: sigma-70 family RNA polymerase sigma factor [Solirubrobacterales bacterium]|nr:sigma-70 family RNA polymerase sigma factor [Solirubrobacterales bacterium]